MARPQRSVATHTLACSLGWRVFRKHLYVFPGQVGMSSYRCEASSVEGFVQVLACNYLPHGYFFFASGVIPEGKDPEVVDRKLIDKYGVAVSRQGRVRRKRAGFANIHYLRFGRFWVLLATHGVHHFFES